MNDLKKRTVPTENTVRICMLQKVINHGKLRIYHLESGKMVARWGVLSSGGDGICRRGRLCSRTD